jgi:hypothetical protein
MLLLIMMTVVMLMLLLLLLIVVVVVVVVMDGLVGIFLTCSFASSTPQILELSQFAKFELNDLRKRSSSLAN